MALVLATTAVAATDVAETKPAATIVTNKEVMAMKIDGGMQYSIDGGQTWMTEAEYNATQPTIEFYTYDEYAAWLEQEKADLQALADAGVSEWTQERVDKAIAMYEYILEQIKQGAMVSKSMENGEGVIFFGSAKGTAAPEEEGIDAAQQVLENYLRAWAAKDWEAMTKYCLPAWRDAQESPAMSLYWTHYLWTLNHWSIAPEATSFSSNSAGFAVLCDLTGSGDAGVAEGKHVMRRYDATVSMDAAGTWYVDPSSMRIGFEGTEALFSSSPEDIVK